MSTINSGLVMRIIPRTVYDFTKHTNAGQNITVPLAMHIDVSMFQEAVFIVRLHTGTTINGPSAFTFNVLYDGYDFSDPATPFFQTNTPSAAVVGTLALSNTTPIPFIQHIPLAANFGRFLMINLVASGVAAGGSGTLIASVDLSLKGGDPSGMELAPNTYRGYRIL